MTHYTQLIAIGLIGLLVGELSAQENLYTENAPVRDVRTRTFLWPTRIVWQSAEGVTNSEKLLASNPRRAYPIGIWEGSGCTLVSTGQTVSVLLDFGRELHGNLQIVTGCQTDRELRVHVRLGESVSEAMSTLGDRHSGNDHAIRDGLVDIPMMGTREIGESGFRFARLDLAMPGKIFLNAVRAVAIERPMMRIGSFASSDSRLNSVFEAAVRTVHLCCQTHLWDGIKRDRLVWMGDTYPELMSILSVYGAAEVLPETLDYAAAVFPVGGDMQGIRNYTLWWVRNLAAWYRYTGDLVYVQKHRAYLVETMTKFLGHVRLDGSFDGKDNFLDWPSKHNEAACRSGTDAHALLSFEDASMLLKALGETALAEQCAAACTRMRGRHPDHHGSKQAAALLALAGLREPREMFERVLGRGGLQGVSTFFGYFMLEAMSAAGENGFALNVVRDYWGAMLDVGSTTFWEDFNVAWTNGACRVDEMPVAGKKDIHRDYGEFCYPGYRCSLCHGWASGPAAWCINHILGIRPLDVGCRTVEVKPFLGDLDWAEGAFALPTGGAVKVRVEKNADGTLRTKVDAPRGITIRR